MDQIPATRCEMGPGTFSFPSLLGGVVLSKALEKFFSEWSPRADFFLSRDTVQEDSPNHL